ncbi:glycine zipper 2TM domain-containing protein, partial [Plasticicumulans sp.]|uniref:glycine zipper 2TM domain-containing protein n=1 Tax=Plasticicumulans sp. TaxID=2307179 RepID=UPI002C56996F
MQPNYGPTYYGGYQTRMTQTVQFGVVEGVRPVVIADRYNSGVGALTGAAIGGIAGSAIGQGRGAAIAAIGGALLGGLAGNAIEGQSAAQTGLE